MTNEFDPTSDYNLGVAIKVITEHVYVGDMEIDVCGRLAADPQAASTGNHFFEWGHTDYSQWEIEGSWAWVAELAPIRDDSGSVVDYVVIEIERVE